jgi:hypothetical protein
VARTVRGQDEDVTTVRVCSSLCNCCPKARATGWTGLQMGRTGQHGAWRSCGQHRWEYSTQLRYHGIEENTNTQHTATAVLTSDGCVIRMTLLSYHVHPQAQHQDDALRVSCPHVLADVIAAP